MENVMKGICYYCNEVVNYEYKKAGYLPEGICKNPKCSHYNNLQSVMFTSDEIENTISLLNTLIELRKVGDETYIDSEKYQKDNKELSYWKNFQDKLNQ